MKTILAVIIIAIGIAACKTAAPDLFLQDKKLYVNPFNVTGKFGSKINQKMSFAHFSTKVVSRSWTTNKGYYLPYWTSGTIGFDNYANIVGKEYHNKKQSISFVLHDSLGHESIAFCITNAKSSNILIGKNKNSLMNSVISLLNRIETGESNYHARIYIKNEVSSWDLLLDNKASQQQPDNYTGYFYKSDTEYYTLKPTNKIIDTRGLSSTIPFGSLGYEIYNTQNQLVAAVSNIGKGKVYLAETNTNEAFLLANLCMAILLEDTI